MSSLSHTGLMTGTEERLAEVLAEVVGVELAPAEPARVEHGPVASQSAPIEVAPRASTPQVLRCGLLQLLTFLGYCCLAALVVIGGLEWVSEASGVIKSYLRSVVFGAASLVGLSALPIVAKWVLIGRWRRQQFGVWKSAYVRFWVVKTLVRVSPLAVFVGSPLYSLYLQALGAKVGRDVVILSRHLPVCTDLLTIGAGTVIRKDAYLSCYRAHAGQIQTGAVTLGRDVSVGEASVLDIDTSGKTYRLYGFHYWAQRSIARMTNVKFFVLLFGDSSYIVHYLRWVGYELSHVEQTGSNFGTGVKHDNPYLCSVGRGTMVADGLSIINTDYSSTSFRVSRTSIGSHNFLGNHIVYPSEGKTGENCLLATKVMVPVDGTVRENVGLLGSPSFEIPRMVERDSSFDYLSGPDELPGRLAAKNRHNVLTMGLFLLVRWIHFFGLTLLAAAAADLYDSFGAVAFALASANGLLFTVVYYTLVERVVTAVRPVRPLFCSIYDLRFWRHERYWKVPQIEYLAVFNGTPFKNVIWRLVGVRIGRRVFDDGVYLTERTLVAIGDDCTLNAGSKIQCHSQEDGSFKSDHSMIGAGSTLGVGALVHYGVRMGEGAILGADSFLMKGEDVPSHAKWEGNPAREHYSATVTGGQNTVGH